MAAAAAAPAFTGGCRLERLRASHVAGTAPPPAPPPPVEGKLRVFVGGPQGRLEFVPAAGSTSVGTVLRGTQLTLAPRRSKKRASIMVDLGAGTPALVFSFLGPTGAPDDWRQRDAAYQALMELQSAHRGAAGPVAATTNGSHAMRGHRNRPGGQIIPTAAGGGGSSGGGAVVDDPALAARLLESDAQLAELYRQVVGSGAITKEEFWRQRQQALLNEQHARPKVGFTPAAGSGDGLQRRDTSTRVEFALDQYQMTKIFLESPAVFTAYLDLVPKRFTKEDFWKQYFRSKYFHQGHSSEPANAKSLKSAERREIDQLFQKYEPSAEEQAAQRRRLAQQVADPHMDLTRTAAESLRWRDVSCHGYGTTDASAAYEPEPLQDKDVAHVGSARNAPRLAMRQQTAHAADTASTIYQTNRLSEAVVKRAKPGTVDEALHTPPAPLPATAQRSASLTDLEGEDAPRFVPLRLKDHTRYFDHSTDDAGTSATGVATATAAAAAAAAARAAPGSGDTVDSLVSSLEYLVHIKRLQLPNAASAAQALAFTTREMMRAAAGTSGQLGAASEPADAGQLAEMHRVNTELLHHFWTRLSAGAQRRAADVLKLLEAKRQELRNMEGTASAAHAPLIASLIKPLDDAVAKYQDIRRKRMKRTATRGAAAAAARKRKEPSP